MSLVFRATRLIVSARRGLENFAGYKNSGEEGKKGKGKIDQWIKVNWRESYRSHGVARL